jgi:hypothetical protein
VSWVFLGLLAVAVAVLVAAEWPRLEQHLGTDGRRRRDRERRKANLRLLEAEPTEEDDFAASVERDLSRLPTIDDERR